MAGLAHRGRCRRSPSNSGSRPRASHRSWAQEVSAHGIGTGRVDAAETATQAEGRQHTLGRACPPESVEESGEYGNQENKANCAESVGASNACRDVRPIKLTDDAGYCAGGQPVASTAPACRRVSAIGSARATARRAAGPPNTGRCGPR